ncbi:Exodeoxyribonuclease 7 large subunit [Vibrio aerogenes CECT 7868]|uniref:Exodeoxyribonuclease 7 large subunit n=1 Tax=Vibrio aerogenes CECT 7868 TaxID=1216006 RepID=A0A1M5YWY2_9VIBR|nr:exodeoxyribonuclease VII large subunit [Vibrio aerogenes]SHI16562.1 Exodeoxyribonuclease 7 large subunit [Vibrio aerogenes CECT 7868]
MASYLIVFVSGNRNIYTVSRLNADVRLLLENEMGIVWLIGEISNFSSPVSGHWYLTLKDTRAQVRCAMFKGSNRFVTFKPQNGQQVLVKARLSLYEPRGDYQLIIESMQPEGDGRLQQEFEQLKNKLTAEGLFAQTNKQPLPEHPQCVGIITSKTGAALFDILDVLKRRDPTLPVVIYPTMVQGEHAAIQIAQAIGRANERQECDVLIVGRGGGSLEDLWSFNQEIVARTIAASQIPVVSAVGHEVDVTIADFVADVRAPTPSAAAELVSQDSSYKVSGFENFRRRLADSIRFYLAEKNQHHQSLMHALEKQHPSNQLDKQARQLDDLSGRLQQSVQGYLIREQQRTDRLSYTLQLHSPQPWIRKMQDNMVQTERRLAEAIDKKILTCQHQLALSAETLDAVSPLSTLKRGYSVTTNRAGKVIHTSDEVHDGETLVTQLADGKIYSTVIAGPE